MFIGRALPSLLLLLVLGGALSLAPPAHAQLGTGTITGIVSDTSGAMVANASVTVVATGTGFRRQTVSNAAGQYNLPGLQPATYDLTVELQGFKSARRPGLVLQVDQSARIDVPLEVGSLSESIEITASSPLVQSENASVGAVVDSQKAIDLPLNGRRFEELATLVPGVNTGAPGANNGGGFSAAGMRSEQNAYQIDGTSNSDAYQNNVSIRPNIDAIQEFKIQTSGYSAEFSKGAGAQINLVTKSGTNEFHGTAYEFVRNNVVQARRLFDANRILFPCDKTNTDVSSRAACAPPWNQNQFGFTLGGPVFFVPKGGGQRKTFFFTSYEGYRLRRGQATRNNVATAAQRRGDFSQNLLTRTTVADVLGRTFRQGQIFDPLSSRPVTDSSGRTRYVREPFVNNVIPLSRFDPVAAKMMQDPAFVPLPNAPGEMASNGNNTYNFLDGRSQKNDWNQFNVRTDHQLTDNDMIFGRWTITNTSTYSPNAFPGFATIASQRNMNGTLSWSKVITPTTLNEMRFGYMGWFELSAAEDHLAGLDWNKKFGMMGFNHLNPQLQGSPDFQITGFTTLGNSSGPLRRRDNTFQFIDNFSFNKGRHFMKVGFDVRRVRENISKASAPRGTLKFDNAQQTGIDGVGNTGHVLANLELGLARQKIRRVSDFYNAFRAAEYGVYFQDDFKVSPNLTLNMGLRYMLYLPPADRNGHLSTLAFKVRCPDYLTCSKNLVVGSPYVPFFGVAEKTAQQWNAVPLPNAIAPTDKKDFGPRFGFAYRPFGQNRTVVRGGYGIFFDTVPMSLTQNTLENWPYVIEDQQDLSLAQNGLPSPEGFIGYLLAAPGLRTGTGGRRVPARA
ncbi:MAG: TonB-dependent receptor [Bryobacterales bacterium]|nr:TonB-dependent receptor [Bryobacterales bacterium]